MPKMRKKGDLPEKICATCGRPFAWRKKWERVWDEVRYCSDKCRASRPQVAPVDEASQARVAASARTSRKKTTGVS